MADFPGGHAGASLKHPHRRAIGLPQVPFPRRTRRGLIEARLFVAPQGGAAKDFPGGHAGASLKPHAVRGELTCRRPISPADTPGPH